LRIQTETELYPTEWQKDNKSSYNKRTQVISILAWLTTEQTNLRSKIAEGVYAAQLVQNGANRSGLVTCRASRNK